MKTRRSATIYKHSEISRFGRWQRARLPLPRSGRRIKVRRAEKNPVRFRIDLAGFGAVLRLHRLDLAELLRRIFVENMHHALAGADVEHAGSRIERVRVYSCRNGI